MRFALLFSMLVLLLQSDISAQQDRIIFDNAQKIDNDRYKGYKGNPYYFKIWVYGDVYNQNGEKYEDLLLNYNIESSTFEVTNGERYLELDPRYYWAVTVKQDKNVVDLEDDRDSIVFIRGLLPDDERKFVEVLYNGSRVKLLKELYVALSSKKIENVGQTIKLKRFNRKDKHFLVVDGEYKKIKMKKKDALKTMGPEKELKNWLKSSKNKLKKDKDWMALMQYYEENHLSPIR